MSKTRKDAPRDGTIIRVVEPNIAVDGITLDVMMYSYVQWKNNTWCRKSPYGKHASDGTPIDFEPKDWERA